MTLRAAVVDDEPLARMRLKRLLEMHDVQVIAEGVNGLQAVQIAERERFDILFVDINMPLMNGIDAVRKIAELPGNKPAIIFCTAYDEYAIEAFSTNAIAYLLKPFGGQELNAAVDKAKQVSRLQLDQMLESQLAEKTITLHRKGAYQNIAISEVVYFFSNEKNNYAVFKDGEKVLVDKTLAQLESHLGDDVVRIHRGYLVNRKEIKLLKQHEGQSYIDLASIGARLVVSRRHLARVRQCFI